MRDDQSELKSEEVQSDRIPKFLRSSFVNLKRSGGFMLKHWSLTAFLASAATVLMATLLHGASPFYPFKQIYVNDRELDRKTEEFRFRQEIAEHYINLAESYMDVGKLDDASQAYDKALKYDDTSIEAKRGLFKAEVLNIGAEEQYEPEVIRRRLEQYFNDFPGEPDAHALTAMANLQNAIGNKKLAIEGYSKAIEQRKEIEQGSKIEQETEQSKTIAIAYFGRASIYIEKNCYESAIDDLKIATESAPFDWRFRYNLAYAYSLNGDDEEAWRQYKKLFLLDADALLPYFSSARMLRIYGHKKNYLKRAKIIQESLSSGLANKVLTDLEKNQDPWTFKIGNGRSVTLFDLETKISYAQHGLAATRHLLEDNDADVPDYHGRDEPKILISYELEQLKKHSPGLAERVDEWLVKIWGPASKYFSGAGQKAAVDRPCDEG